LRKNPTKYADVIRKLTLLIDYKGVKCININHKANSVYLRMERHSQ